MDLENKKGDYADVYIGPYKATRLVSFNVFNYEHDINNFQVLSYAVYLLHM